MTWRPTKYLLEGELDNTKPGKVTGWMKFAGMKNRVTFDLDGDFCRDIRGAIVVLAGKYEGICSLIVGLCICYYGIYEGIPCVISIPSDFSATLPYIRGLVTIS